MNYDNLPNLPKISFSLDKKPSPVIARITPKSECKECNKICKQCLYALSQINNTIDKIPDIYDKSFIAVFSKWQEIYRYQLL